MRLFKNKLGQKIVMLMILSSAFLSFFASIIQLYLSYERDIERVENELTIVDRSFRSSLEYALWSFSFEQVNALIDGIFAQADVVYVELVATTGESFVRGTPVEEDVRNKDFTLKFKNSAGDVIIVGQLGVTASLRKAQIRIRNQFFELILSNFVKTLIASIIMLLIFDRLLARHLRSLTKQLTDSDWETAKETVRLPHRSNGDQDDLDHLVDALNDSWRKNAKSASDQIAEVRDRLELVLNSATSGIVAFDAAGEVVMTNSRAGHLLGGLNDQTPFKWPESTVFLDIETLQPLDRDADPVHRALAGKPVRRETHLMRRAGPGGDRRYVRIDSVTLDEDDSNVSTVLVIDDVSDEERNRQVVERKSRLDALGQVTGGIAHDFNNLLGAMLYAIDLAGRSENADQRKKYLDTASTSVNRGRELTARLLAFARRQPGLVRTRLVSEIFAEFEKLVRPMIEAQIEVSLSVDDDRLQVSCDLVQLETALMNLVLNSRDAILRSGVGNAVNVRCRPATAPNLDTVRENAVGTSAESQAGSTLLDETMFLEISVSDNGPGMDDETLKRATDPFFTTKDSNSGTGLGLAIVYGFARQSNGDLRIYSEEGRGTTVQMVLPSGGIAEGAMTPEFAEPPAKGAGETILLVEDELALRMMMSDVLEDLGYGVIGARNGEEALNLIDAGESFDLLLTDVVMPGSIGGFELARRVREQLPDMPVIYTSGYTGYTAEEMGIVKARLLQKPVSPTELAQAIAQEIRTKTVSGRG